MEAISRILERDINKTIDPTVAALAPLLKRKRNVIKGTLRKTFDFGPKSRNKLDIYYPASAPVDPGAKTPILVWAYGGGFNTGDRSLSPATFGLVYNNIGAYFTQRGFIVVIPDYRLVPEVVFPESAEDIRDAILWTVENTPTCLVSPTTPHPDLESIMLMGHSAGAVHLATILFHPDILPLDGSGPKGATELRSRIRAAVLVSGPHDAKQVFPTSSDGVVYKQYWGSMEEARYQDPRHMYDRASDELVQRLPHILLVEGEWEPDWIGVGQESMQEAVLKREGKKLKRITALGHNHISVVWAIGTGEGEAWAEQALEWYHQLPHKAKA